VSVVVVVVVMVVIIMVVVVMVVVMFEVVFMMSIGFLGFDGVFQPALIHLCVDCVIGVVVEVTPNCPLQGDNILAQEK